MMNSEARKRAQEAEPDWVDPTDLVLKVQRLEQQLSEARQKAEYWQYGCETIQEEMDAVMATHHSLCNENRDLHAKVAQLSLQLVHALLTQDAA